jgi:NitT/TauT family transport system permease protein
MPYFLSACRSSMGLAWKAGIAAEVLTVPEHSIGKMIYESKLYLETTDLFVWTVTVILLSFLLEKSAMKLIGILGRRYNANEVSVNA